jgi:methionyl-tRNA synthetase
LITNCGVNVIFARKLQIRTKKLKEPKRYTITSALPYANGPLHIGHVAGAYLPADIYVRYLRSNNKDVLFICGSDEHGAAITIRAKKDGTTPKEIVDKYHGMLSEAFKGLNINFDFYHRTSSELHHETASDFFKTLNDNGSFEVKESEQYFDEEHQQFLADRYIKGECPKCGNPDAFGDQCEKCGSVLSPRELINPVSTLSGNSPQLKTTSHWYLPMQNHEEWLKPWIEEGILDGQPHHDPKAWKSHVLGQCKSWIDGGLQPRAMTRDLDWGVKVPIEGADGKVLYVWLDAPIGYISSTKQWAADNGKNWEDYWKDDETKLLHFIGKDNIVFHCIIFPILLKAHGDYILPDNVPANSFLNLEGKKLSTGRNWAVWAHEYLERYPDKVDELRYTLTANAPEARDSEFTWLGWQSRINNELVKNYGNFVNRALVLTNKNFDGKVPACGELTELDKEFITQVAAFPAKIASLIENYQFREAQAEAMLIADAGDKYLSKTEPWKMVKSGELERAGTVLNLSVQVATTLAIVFEPFLPNTSATLFGYLNIDALKWDKAGNFDLIPAGHQLNPAKHLFQRVEDKTVETEKELLEAAKKQQSSNPDAAPQKDTITFEDFTKMDVRVGEILTAERVPKADKLLKLTVDTGIDKRTVVSGIAEHFQPEDIVGQKVSILMNLAPRKIRGVESQGMILMAENAEGKLSFVEPGEDMIPGNEIR